MVAQLIVTREKSTFAMARKTKLFIDGEKVGTVGNGQEVVLEAPAGSHQLEAKVDWMKAVPITVNLDDASPTRVSLVLPGAFAGLFRSFWKPGSAMTFHGA